MSGLLATLLGTISANRPCPDCGRPMHPDAQRAMPAADQGRYRVAGLPGLVCEGGHRHLSQASKQLLERLPRRLDEAISDIDKAARMAGDPAANLLRQLQQGEVCVTFGAASEAGVSARASDAQGADAHSAGVLADGLLTVPSGHLLSLSEMNLEAELLERVEIVIALLCADPAKLVPAAGARFGGRAGRRRVMLHGVTGLREDHADPGDGAPGWPEDPEARSRSGAVEVRRRERAAPLCRLRRRPAAAGHPGRRRGRLARRCAHRREQWL